MKPIQVFGVGTASKSTNVTAQKRINFYLDVRQDADKTAIVAIGTPGTTLFVNLGDSPVRGFWTIGDYTYAVHRGTVYKIDNAGTAVSKGTIDTTSGRVGMHDNGTQIMIATGVSGYIYTLSTDTVAKITDVDYPGGDTVTFLDGYFIVNYPDTGKSSISASYNGAAWDALDFATAEYSPDELIAVFADNGRLQLLCEFTTEIWQNTGALDFPFSRVAAIEWGLAARWSVAKFGNGVVFLAKSRIGGVQVVYLVGGNASVISTTDMDYLLNNSTVAAAATALSYLHDGHQFYQLNVNSESWLYDEKTREWSQLKSGSGRHRAEIAATYLNRTIVTDYENGKIFNIDGDVYADNGYTIIAELVTKHTTNNMERIAISELFVDIETGVGLATGQGSDPQIMLQVSKDGGHNFGNERWRSMGKIGKFKTRVRWLRLGQAYDWVFRLKISDPVKRVILSMWIK